MRKTELSEICNISRQTIYNAIDKGLGEFEILKMYTTPLNRVEEYVINPNKKEQILMVDSYNKGFNDGTLKTKNTMHDLIKIKKIITKVILEYQQSEIKEIGFININEIFEIVKKY